MKKYNELNTKPFSKIGLDELNNKAKMLDRSENKYILTVTEINTVIKDLAQEFDILSIDGKSKFKYETVYFDDNGICYKDHHQGKRKRFKARTRLYCDQKNLAFLELKLKGARGRTKKFRLPCDKSKHGILTNEGIAMIKKEYEFLYKKDFIYNLSPVVTMAYDRVTLVAKSGGERMTIDFNLNFSKEKDSIEVPESFVIVETKSKKGNGIADQIFRSYKFRSDSCSKFCLSMILLKQVGNYSTFKSLMKKYHQSE